MINPDFYIMSLALSAIIILLIITFVIDHGDETKQYLGFNQDQIITITSGLAMLIGVVLIVYMSYTPNRYWNA